MKSKKVIKLSFDINFMLNLACYSGCLLTLKGFVKSRPKIATDFVELKLQRFACLFIFMKLWVVDIHCKTIAKDI